MNKNLKIEYVPIGELKAYERNAKLHPQEQIQQIKNSILEFGFNDPIAVWKDNEIIEGHGRLLAAQELGYKELPIIRLDDLSDEQRKAYMLAHNQLTMNTGFDLELLNIELDSINDIDMTEFGFEFEMFSDDSSEVVEDDYNEELPEEPKAKLGDIYKLGNHRLMCGDSTDTAVIDKLMDGVKADMVLSDPPYGMKLDTDFSKIKGSMKFLGRKNHTEGNKYEKVIGDNEDFKSELITTLFTNFDYVKEMFLFGADYFAELLPEKNKGSWLVWDKRKESQADAIGSEFELIWSRNKHKRRMLRHDWFGFLSSENGADARNRVHPTQKPITLLVDILNQWGKDTNVIVDLYGGSGSTLIACEQLNRKCYMCELDPRYVDVIINRWEQFTGQKAVKLN
ncbi:MAG TPA: DNA methyltransferase [Ruminococcus flavefaciens]|nr:DNA methyltransferase [Ruminococcus flavefaciens]